MKLGHLPVFAGIWLKTVISRVQKSGKADVGKYSPDTRLNF